MSAKVRPRSWWGLASEATKLCGNMVGEISTARGGGSDACYVPTHAIPLELAALGLMAWARKPVCSSHLDVYGRGVI
jgi:hypothetical protein